MAAASAQAWPALAPEQRKLLLAALASNKKRKSEADSTANTTSPNAGDTTGSDGVNPSVFTNSSSDPFAMTSAAPSAFDLTADDSAFDVDFGKSFGDFDDAFPDFNAGESGGEQGEKRKNSELDDDDALEEEHGDEKRRDSEPKEAKKPGRKLLTSEPTTKRKAQNRAAQRAFRERKEKHLKDLETKVADLEKASESANHENSVLRAQVERLQDEVKDYKRRFSLAGGSLNGSPSSNRPSLDGDQSLGSSSLGFNFNFDFPKFGAMPGSALPANQAIGSTQQGQSSQSYSSYDSNNPNETASHQASISSVSNGQSQNQANGQNSYGAPLFGAGFFDIMGGNVTTSPQQKSMSLNGSLKDTNGRPSPAQSNTSASRSPASNHGNGPSSSCCTSPDPVDWTTIYNASNGPQSNHNSISGNNTTPGLTNAKTPGSDSFSLDFLANQNGGSFDPVLFGDYRDPQNAIVGDEAFSGGFFEDSLALPDFNSPFNFNVSADTTNPAPAPSNGVLKQMQSADIDSKKKPNLLEQVAKQRDGDYEDQSDEQLLMPNSKDDYSKKTPSLMTCHKIWNQLQNCPKFKSGDFDVDTLCSELSSKARCTETGVAVPTEAVEAALWKLAGAPGSGQQPMLQPDAMSPASNSGEAEKKPDPRSEAARRFEEFMASN